jgi:hypothetical protein
MSQRISLLVFTGIDRRRKRVSIAFLEAGGSDSGTRAPGAFLTTNTSSHTGFLRSILITTGDAEISEVLVFTSIDRGWKGLSIGFLEAGGSDSSALTPRAFLIAGRPAHAVLLRSILVAVGDSLVSFLVFTVIDRGREGLSIVFSKTSGTDGSTVTPGTFLSVRITSTHTLPFGSEGVTVSGKSACED